MPSRSTGTCTAAVTDSALTLQGAAGRALRPEVADTLQKQITEVDAIRNRRYGAGWRRTVDPRRRR